MLHLRFAMSVLGFIAVGSLAQAQDFGSFPQSRVTRAWDGLYAGVHLGYTSTDYSAVLNPGADIYNATPDDATYGLYGGYNVQWNSMVVAGIEGDITGSLPDGAGLAGATLVMSNMDWSASLRGRLGFTVDQFLIYATAGVALSDIDYTAGGASDSEMAIGGVIGIGAEAQVWSNVTARAEYLYTSYGSGTYALGPLTASGDLDTHTLRVGIGYDF